MNYVDGFVLPVQKKKVAAYRSMAKLSAKTFPVSQYSMMSGPIIDESISTRIGVSVRLMI